jgi:hypothetical protein
MITVVELANMSSLAKRFLGRKNATHKTWAEIMKIGHGVLFRINSLNYIIPIDSGLLSFSL